MSTVWVVESGEYSDYKVVGLFSAEQGARQVALIVGGTAAEWPLDAGLAAVNRGQKPFAVTMHRDGAVLLARRSDEYKADDEYLLHWNKAGPLLTAMVWALDEQHAVKIADEYRLGMLAIDAWDEAREATGRRERRPPVIP